MLDAPHESRKPPSRGDVAAARDLAHRIFVMQDDRPEDLADVEVAVLDPFVRSLLVTDGTVTRALEVHTLERVTVEVVSQSMAPTPGRSARCLEIEPGTESVRRRVVMTVGDSSTHSVCAESFIVPERLPGDFLGTLAHSSEGIGEALQQVLLESWRELLWFGLGRAPEWAPIVPTPTVLTRVYRVMTAGHAALLIAESFALELTSDTHHLAGMSNSDS
ncbi:MAG TPA: chorismate pyruvate-lyase family protein [Thermoleophilaceae bacterium]|jgi:chorismate-pyruvate lyase